MGDMSCNLKMLPQNLWEQAAKKAIEISPTNAPAVDLLRAAAPTAVISPQHLAIITARRWGNNRVRLTVGFLDGPPADLRARILAHMNAWGSWANVQFSESSVNPQVRIARTAGDGYWSYLGTDIQLIPAG